MEHKTGHPMRRKDRALEGAETAKLLREGVYGVLSTVGPEGLPYGVPLSYVMDGDDVCFHCAMRGHKIANLQHQPGVTFTVVGEVEAVFRSDFTTRYESAVVHGTAEWVEDPAEKTRLLRLLCEKYLPEHMDKFDGSVAASLTATGVWRIRAERTTGKANR